MRNLRSRVTIVPYLCLLCPGTNMTSCRMQMQNAECRISSKAVNCTRCRMQMQNAECRIGPKAGCLSTRCRMQDADAGCGIGLKAVSCTRRTNSLGLILHPARRTNILGWVLHSARSASAFCIFREIRNVESARLCRGKSMQSVCCMLQECFSGKQKGKQRGPSTLRFRKFPGNRGCLVLHSGNSRLSLSLRAGLGQNKIEETGNIPGIFPGIPAKYPVFCRFG